MKRRPFSNFAAQALVCFGIAAIASVAAGAAEALAPLSRSVTDFNREVAAFRQKLPTLSAEQAAAEWLALADREATLSPAVSRDGDDSASNGEPQATTLDTLMAALPPPSAWATLAKAVDARRRPQPQSTRDLGLRLLAHTLSGDAAAEERDIAALEALPEPQAESQLRQRHQLKALLSRAPGGPDRVARDVESRLASLDPDNMGASSLSLPDVVSLLGAERAQELIRRAVVAPAFVQADAGTETASMVRRVALQSVKDMQVPQWDLVGPDAASIPLYEALARQFPPQSPGAVGGRSLWSQLLGSKPKQPPRPRVFDQHRREKAAMNYLVALIAARRTQEAAAILRAPQKTHQTLGGYAFRDALSRTGNDAAVFDVLDSVLEENPSLPYWPTYRALAARLGRSDAMLKRALAAASRDGLDEAERATIRTELYKALLAADRVEEAVEAMRQLLKAAPAKPGAGEDESRGQLGLELATLGRLLGEPAWTDEGLSVARAALAKMSGDAAADNDTWPVGYQVNSLTTATAKLMLAEGQGREAAGLLADGVARARAARERQLARARQDGFFAGSALGDEADRELLVELLGVYHRAGRHADVLAQLDTLPNFGAKDLAEIYREKDSAENPVGFMAAAALADVGRRDEARKVLDAVLDADPNFDPAYELLLKLDTDAGAGATLRRLDELFSLDRFEERPLIWKARTLYTIGRHDDAEKAVRDAIAIDPSDGEQGPGRRMRAYAVLADVLEAKGDAKQALFFRNVVKSIRLSEHADELYQAGLLSRGVAQYREALKFFQDAYCIQSRLAVQLAEQGMTEQAAVHYRRAYELMPDSFGRVESHCFGCEGAFRGGAAQGIAEQVFQRLVAAEPRKPQVHYLLAYLRRNQGRMADALPPLRTAVSLDPDYLNAWKELENLAKALALSPEERDTATLNVLRLDPLRRHSSPELSEVTDLPALWKAVDAAQPFQVKPPAALYPLKASAAELVERKAKANQGERGVMRRSHVIGLDDFDAGQPLPTPAEVIARTRVVRMIKALIGGSEQLGPDFE